MDGGDWVPVIDCGSDGYDSDELAKTMGDASFESEAECARFCQAMGVAWRAGWVSGYASGVDDVTNE